MRTPCWRFLAVLATALLPGATACDWETDGAARLSEQYHPDTGADLLEETAPDAVADEGVAPSDPGETSSETGGYDLDPGEVTTNLEGLWAVRIRQLGTIAPLSDPYPITTPDYFVGTVEPVGTKMTLTFCNEIPVVETGDPELQFITRIPQALRDALAAAPVELALGEAAAGLPGQQQMWTWGLQDISRTDPMPTEVNAKVRDQDQDGKPGVTVEVDGTLAQGKRYMVKRVVWDLSPGTMSEDHLRVSGTLTYTLDEQPLGGDPEYLNQATPITPVDGSTFLMRRVGAMDCASLLAHLDEVFAD